MERDTMHGEAGAGDTSLHDICTCAYTVSLTDLEDPLIHKKVLQTVFGIRAFFFCSNPIRALFEVA